MKTIEAMQALQENPNKTFVCKLGEDVTIGLKLVANTYFEFTNIVTSGDGSIFGIGKDLEWEEVRTLVTWEEALDAWVNKGKTICCEFQGETYEYRYSNYLLLDSYDEDERGVPMSKGELGEGTWYIKS